MQHYGDSTSQSDETDSAGTEKKSNLQWSAHIPGKVSLRGSSHFSFFCVLVPEIPEGRCPRCPLTPVRLGRVLVPGNPLRRTRAHRRPAGRPCRRCNQTTAHQPAGGCEAIMRQLRKCMQNPTGQEVGSCVDLGGKKVSLTARATATLKLNILTHHVQPKLQVHFFFEIIPRKKSCLERPRKPVAGGGLKKSTI